MSWTTELKLSCCACFRLFVREFCPVWLMLPRMPCCFRSSCRIATYLLRRSRRCQSQTQSQTGRGAATFSDFFDSVNANFSSLFVFTLLSLWSFLILRFLMILLLSRRQIVYNSVFASRWSRPRTSSITNDLLGFQLFDKLSCCGCVSESGFLYLWLHLMMINCWIFNRLRL